MNRITSLLFTVCLLFSAGLLLAAPESMTSNDTSHKAKSHLILDNSNSGGTFFVAENGIVDITIYNINDKEKDKPKELGELPPLPDYSFKTPSENLQQNFQGSTFNWGCDYKTITTTLCLKAGSPSSEPNTFSATTADGHLVTFTIYVE